MSKRVLTLTASVCGVVFLPATAAIALLYLWANGVTAGALVLATLPLLAILGFVAARRASRRRPALAALALLVAVDLLWTAARIARSGGEGLRVCVNTQCDGRGAFWQRVPDEREAARAGLHVSSLAGTVSDAEFKAFDVLLDAEYARVPAAWRGLPNALLMGSSRARIESHRWVPRGPEGKAPCIVFLHGFGGPLTLYLRTIVESAIGERFVVVAPALDTAWSRERGLDVLERVVTEQLPAEVDRTRVYLVGLSSGAIGVTTVLSRPKLRALFKAAVMISGVREIDRSVALRGTRVLLFAGLRDPRFPHSGVKEQADALRDAGAEVELVSLDADHYLILTHAPEWTARVAAWEGSVP